MTFASLVDQVVQIINSVLPVLASMALLLLIYGLLMYVYSAAEGKKEQSKDIMVWGIVAMFVLTSLWGIIVFINQAFTGGTSVGGAPGTPYQSGSSYAPGTSFQPGTGYTQPSPYQPGL